MKGIHKILLQNKRVRYEFEIRRNLTILRGDSATGKTTLIDMIREYINNESDSSIQLVSDKKCNVLEGSTWKGQLAVMQDSIVFIDEGNSFVFSDEFSDAIQDTDNYYVIVSREALPNLPYSVTEIYGIRTSGKYGGLKQHYNEFYRIYGDITYSQHITPELVITEDSNAGYQFFHDVCSKNNIECISANGKSKILHTAKMTDNTGIVLLIADGAAFGSEMNRVMQYILRHNNIMLYVPESFEWLILSADLLKNQKVMELLDDPSEYIESRDFFSWERFFTKILTDNTRGTWLQYSKRRINPNYLQKEIESTILEQINLVSFD